MIILFVACHNQNESGKKDLQNQAAITQSDTSYPKEINNQELKGKYDVAKWAMYCFYSGDTVKLKRNAGIDLMPMYSSLDLKFENIELRNDSAIIYFDFYFDSLKCDVTKVEPGKTEINGVVFKNDSIVCYTTPTTLTYIWGKGIIRDYNNHLPSKIIHYINVNRDKLNPWFYYEAKKRGVIKK